MPKTPTVPVFNLPYRRAEDTKLSETFARIRAQLAERSGVPPAPAPNLETSE